MNLHIGIILACIAGFLHGIDEGMDMHLPNIREHHLFNIYHRLIFLKLVFVAWFGYYLFGAFGLWLIPALILANRFAEIGYGWVRFKVPFPDYENFMGFVVIREPMLSLIQLLLWILGIATWIKFA